MTVSQLFGSSEHFSSITGKSYPTREAALDAEATMGAAQDQSHLPQQGQQPDAAAYNQALAQGTARVNQEYIGERAATEHSDREFLRPLHEAQSAQREADKGYFDSLSGWGTVIGAGLGLAVGAPSVGAGLGGALGAYGDNAAANPAPNTSFAANQANASQAQAQALAPRVETRTGTGGIPGAGGPPAGAYSALPDFQSISDGINANATYQADNATATQQPLVNATNAVSTNRANRSTDNDTIEQMFNSAQLDNSLADQARADQQEGLDMQRSLIDRLTGSDGGIGESTADVVSRFDGLSLDTSLADQSRQQQQDAIALNQGLLSDVQGSQGRFDETADELTSRYDAINVDTTDATQARGLQSEGLDMQRALYERLMRDDAEALSGAYSGRALANQLSLARSAGGGAGARQLAQNRVNDNSASVYSQAQLDANKQIMSQLASAGGVADSFGGQAQGIRGLDLNQQELLSSVDLAKTGGVADAQQTALNQLLQSQGITAGIGSSIGSQAGAIRGADEQRTSTQAGLDTTAAQGVAQARQAEINQLAARDALQGNVASAFGNQAGQIRTQDENRAATEADLALGRATGMANLYAADHQLTQQETQMLGDFEQEAARQGMDWAKMDQKERQSAIDVIMEGAGIAADRDAAKLMADALAYRFETKRDDASDAEDFRRQNIRAKNDADTTRTVIQAGVPLLEKLFA